MMKNIYLHLFLFLCFSGSQLSPLSGQQDTITITEEFGSELVDYLTPMEYAYMMHEETKWMFKLGFPVGGTERPVFSYSSLPGNIRATTSFSFGYEHKLGQEHSLNVAFELLGAGDDELFANVVIGPRWYYNMKKRIEKKQGQSNLSGNYLGAGAKYQFNTDDGGFFSLFGQWGSQRRFLKRGYIDFGVQAELSFPLDTDLYKDAVFSLGSKINVGLAWAQDKQTFDESKLCDIFKCYESNNRILKLNLAQALNVGFAKNLRSLLASGDISYEQKLGKSPFSINGQLVLTYSNNRNFERFGFSKIRTSSLIFSGRIGPRFYYNLKKRIAKGKGGNGLSGNYLSLDFARIAYRVHNKSDNEIFQRNRDRTAVDFLMGFQRIIADNLYYDIRFGVGTYLGNVQYFEERIRIPFRIGVGVRL